MIDYCLKCADEAECNAILLSVGLIDENGNPVSPQVCLDRIGPITTASGTYYPEYYANLRLLEEPTQEQADALATISIEPGPPQYRVWA